MGFRGSSPRLSTTFDCRVEGPTRERHLNGSALPRAVHEGSPVNILRSIILAVALSVSACYAQAPAPTVKDVRSFDVATCAPDGFIAASIEISKDALTAIKRVPGPGVIELLSPPLVYKLTIEDKDGKHYVLGDFEIVVDHVDKDGILIGTSKNKGKVVAIFYGVESNGSDAKLLTNSTDEHDACVDFLKSEKGKAPKEQNTPIVNDDPSVSKT